MHGAVQHIETDMDDKRTLHVLSQSFGSDYIVAGPRIGGHQERRGHQECRGKAEQDYTSHMLIVSAQAHTMQQARDSAPTLIRKGPCAV